MSEISIGLLFVSLLLLLLAIRVPVAVALGGISFAGIWIIRDFKAAIGTLGFVPYEFASNWTLSAIPMFLLMGALAFHSKMTSNLFTAAAQLTQKIPGGLAVATNLASAGFSAATGSSSATTAAMSRLAIPEMLRLKYDPGLAAGVVAAAGTLGALIPPSIAFIVYGWYASVPIGKLFVAGILPRRVKPPPFMG